MMFKFLILLIIKCIFLVLLFRGFFLFLSGLLSGLFDDFDPLPDFIKDFILDFFLGSVYFVYCCCPLFKGFLNQRFPTIITTVILEYKYSRHRRLSPKDLYAVASLLHRLTRIFDNLDSFFRNFNGFSRNFNSFFRNFNSFFRNFNSFFRNFNSFFKNFNSFSRNLNSFSRNFNSFSRNFNSFSRNFNSFSRNFNSFSRNFNSFSRNFNSFSRNVYSASGANERNFPIDRLLGLLGVVKSKLTYEESLVKDVLWSSENRNLSLHSRQKKLLSLKSSFSGEPIDALLKELETAPFKKRQLQQLLKSFCLFWKHIFFVKRSGDATNGSKRIVQTSRAYFPIIEDFLSCERKSVLLAHIIQKAFSEVFLTNPKKFHRGEIPFHYILTTIGSTALDYIVNAAFKDYQKCPKDNPYITDSYSGLLILILINIRRGASSADKILITAQIIYLRKLKVLKKLQTKLKKFLTKLENLEAKIKEKLNKLKQLKKDKFILIIEKLILIIEKSNLEKEKSNLEKDKSNLEKDKSNLKKDKSILKKDKSILKINKSISKINKSILKLDKSILKLDKSILKKDKSILKKDNSILKKDKSISKLEKSILKIEESILKIKKSVSDTKKSILDSSCDFVCDDIDTFRKKFSLIPCIQLSEAYFFGFLLIKVFEHRQLITITGGDWSSYSPSRRSIITISLSDTDYLFDFIRTAPVSAITSSSSSFPFICADYLTLNKSNLWEYDNHPIGLPLIRNSDKVLHISEDRIATIETQVKQGFEICEFRLDLALSTPIGSLSNYIKNKKNSISAEFGFSFPYYPNFSFLDFIDENRRITRDYTLLRKAYKEFLLEEFFFYSFLKSCALFSNFRLYFPIFLDFRGRLYLDGSLLNPTGNKTFVRNFFRFPYLKLKPRQMFEVDIHAQGIQILSLLSVERLGLNYTGLLPFRKNSVVIRNKDKPDLYSFFAVKWRSFLIEFISSKIFINSPENATSEDCLKFKRLANTDQALQTLLIDFIDMLTDRRIVKTLVMFGTYGESIYSQIKRLRKDINTERSWFKCYSRLSIAISKQSLTMPRKKDDLSINDLCLIKNANSLLRRFLDLFVILQQEHLPEITKFIKNIKLLISCITKLTGKKNSLNLSFDNSFTTTSTYDNLRKFIRSNTANTIHCIDALIVDRVLKKIHVIKYAYSENGIEVNCFTIHDAFYVNPEHEQLIKDVYKEALRELFADDFIEALLAANNLTYSDIAKESKPLAEYFQELARKRKNFLRKNSF